MHQTDHIASDFEDFFLFWCISHSLPPNAGLLHSSEFICKALHAGVKHIGRNAECR